MTIDPKAAAANVLRLVAIRFGAAAVREPGTIGAELSKAARARGLSIPLADYLETLARRHDLFATAFRLAARAARSEDAEALALEPLERTKHGVYFASKAQHGPRWQALRSGGLPVCSTWIDESGEGETSDWADLWLGNVTEASSARVIIAYNEPGERMKGALVEIGAALACETRVLWVGSTRDPESKDYTVISHPLVAICPSLDAAVDAARAVLEGSR